MGDGIGWCTGTSMSAPQIAGVVGLLRSINPLAPQGLPESPIGDKPGLRTVMAETASRIGVWDPKLGYGIPDAAAAARRTLGKAAGATVRNRATPLFRLWQATTRDFAETSSPQYALGLMINQARNYVQPASGLGTQPVVGGYDAFPWDTNDPLDTNDSYDTTPPAAPRAAIYVLTTEYKPRPEWPDLVPLHLMDKDYAGGKDHMLVTTATEMEEAYLGSDDVHCNNGYLDNGQPGCFEDDYDLRTIQGYIFQPCAPEPDCIPPGAQNLWRKYRVADDDCAVFLNDERPAFEAAGYTVACPAGSTTMLGYAYPATDWDDDGLPNGFEYVVGTNPLPGGADSDNDGSGDAVELPLAGIPVSDPCMGGTLGATLCGANILFQDGFDGA